MHTKIEILLNQLKKMTDDCVLSLAYKANGIDCVSQLSYTKADWNQLTQFLKEHFIIWSWDLFSGSFCTSQKLLSEIEVIKDPKFVSMFCKMYRENGNYNHQNILLELIDDIYELKRTTSKIKSLFKIELMDSKFISQFSHLIDDNHVRIFQDMYVGVNKEKHPVLYCGLVFKKYSDNPEVRQYFDKIAVELSLSDLNFRLL